MLIKNRRKIPKRLISLLIVLTLMLSCFTFTASANEVTLTDFTVYDTELIENCSGYERSDYNDDTDEYGLSYFYYEPYGALRYSAEFSDGTIYAGSTGEFFDDYGVRYTIGIENSQSYENQWKVGKSYPITVTLYADDTEVTRTTATVKIVESPIESVTVEPVSLIEYTNGYFTEDYESGEEFFEYSFDSKMNISILWKDGTTTETDGYGVNYNDNWYRFDTITNQSAVTPWTAGNTYSAEISVMGKTVDVPVTITESPVESITAEPVTLLENSDGYIEEDYDTGEEYFCYEVGRKMLTTIFWKDGTTTETENNGLYYDDEWYTFDVTTNQSADNPWTAGNTYSACVSFMGASATVPVTIQNTPVKSITAKPVSLIEYGNGYMTEDYETGEEYYYYTVEDNIIISVLWEDGTTTETYGFGVNYKGEWYSYDITTNQSADNPWTVGNTYSAQVSLMGVSTTVPVTVVETPVNSIIIEPLTLIENLDGDYDGDFETGEEYFCYAISDKLQGTILWKDGTATEFSGNDVNYEDSWYSFDVTTDQSYDNPWTAGNTYSAQVSLMGVSSSVPVTIIDYPIESVELKKLPERTTYNIGEVFSLKGAVIRINYKDGTYEDINVDYSGDAFALCGYDFYVKELDDYCTMYIEGYGCATAESGYFTVGILGDFLEIPISVTERSIISVDAQNKGNQLELTVGYSDGTEQTMNALDLIAGYGDISGEGTVVGGILITDKAILSAEILVTPDNENILIRVYNSDTYVSTGKVDSIWWDTLDVIKTLAFSSSCAYGEIETFAGVINAENIDALAKIVCVAESLLFSEDSVYDEENDCFIIPANLIEDGFASVFGINPDLTLSNNYNPDNNTYSIVNDSLGAAYKQPIQIEYKDGTTVAKLEWTSPRFSMTLTLDDALKLIGLEFTEDSGYQLGDVNKDGKVNIKDATEIQKHVAKIVSLDDEAKGVADYDGDGRITVKDATAIQKMLAGII